MATLTGHRAVHHNFYSPSAPSGGSALPAHSLDIVSIGAMIVTHSALRTTASNSALPYFGNHPVADEFVATVLYP